MALNRESMAVQFDLDGSDFEAIENIGSGAYGVVCSAVDKKSGARVAIKKISDIFAQPTIAMRTYREIKILRHFKHENIIGIKNILNSKENDKVKDIYIVFNLMETDLHRVIYSSQPLSLEHIRYFLYQVVRGLKFIHSANILHRDLKPSNLLVNENCDLKIGDFGMARGISSTTDDESERQLTHYVATRWYRAPELLLQSPDYSTAVDMWSVGCILAELINRKTLFPGRNMLHQLELIFSFFGAPSNNCMDMSFSDKIRRFIKYKFELNKIHQEDISSKFLGASKDGLSLLSGLLQLDSCRRFSAVEVLEHQFLATYHDPTDEPGCPRLFDFSFEQEFKKYSGPQNVDKLCNLLQHSIDEEIQRYERLIDFPAAMMNLPKSRVVPYEKETSLPETSHHFTKIKNNNLVAAGNEDLCTTANTHEPRECGSEITHPAVTTSDNSIKSNLPAKPSKVCANSDPTDVDMLSAKLGSASIRDVEMPSPVTRSLNSETTEVQSTGTLSDFRTSSSESESNTTDANAETSIDFQEKLLEGKSSSLESRSDKNSSYQFESQTSDAKAKIKAALLFNSELKKERMRLVIESTKNTKQPVTALQRQKEREEKRRLKMERALRRKEKLKDGILKHSEKLSYDDKKLLERWNNMQKHLRVENSNGEQLGHRVDLFKQGPGASDKSFVSLPSYQEGEDFTLLASEISDTNKTEGMQTPLGFFAEARQGPESKVNTFSGIVPPVASFPVIEQTFPTTVGSRNIILFRDENSEPLMSSRITTLKNYPHYQSRSIHSKDRQHHLNHLDFIAKRCQFSTSVNFFTSNCHPVATSLPTISTILPPNNDNILRINKELIKLSDIKESQESAPLSATLLADWREMTKEIDAGDLEAAVLDFEHAPTKINLCDINSMLPHS